MAVACQAVELWIRFEVGACQNAGAALAVGWVYPDQAHSLGAVADVVGIGSAAFLRQVEVSWLSGEVNGLTGGLGERLPSVDLSHGDLA